MNIQTERLELKPIRVADLEALADLLTDPIVGKTYMVPDFADKAEAENLALRIISLSQEENRNVAGIFLADRLIGMLNETDRGEDYVEVGYALLPAYYGKGYAAEALRGAIDFFFAQGFQRVLAGAFEENRASLRVMEKSGMLRLRRQDTVTYRGKEYRCVYYCATRFAKVRITALRKTCHPDLMEQYENPIEHTCDVEEGMTWISENGQRPEGLCHSAWESMASFVQALTAGDGNFYDGWMKDPHSAMISCNDGFRPVSFYLEVIPEAQ